MVNNVDFLNLSKRYLESAELLLGFGKFDVAYYLAGYSVECLIKAIICTKINLHEFPPKNASNSHYIHDIVKLIETADLKKDLDFERERSPELDRSFMILKDWDPRNLRYDPACISEETAKNYIAEINNTKGLVLWLNKYL